MYTHTLCTHTPTHLTHPTHSSQRLGDRVVPLRQRVEGSVEWARLESAGECGLQDYLHSLNNNNRGKPNKYQSK